MGSRHSFADEGSSDLLHRSEVRQVCRHLCVSLEERFLNIFLGSVFLTIRFYSEYPIRTVHSFLK